MPSICIICREPYEGHGNNAQPVLDGRCCDDCNATVVVPTRMRRLRASRTKPERPMRRAENDGSD